ncbi:hypothetical protein [Kitasatospora sp. NPDC093558]|uniref:hypothetical protein n=1 Tax=Kitasatospora sp. NPDC093558 TaxID=3155201 RepID=UPI00342C7DD2
MRTRIIATCAAVMLSVAAAATLSSVPVIDWPASPAIRIVGAGQGNVIDWPVAPSAPLASGGETGVIDWP